MSVDKSKNVDLTPAPPTENVSISVHQDSAIRLWNDSFQETMESWTRFQIEESERAKRRDDELLKMWNHAFPHNKIESRYIHPNR